MILLPSFIKEFGELQEELHKGWRCQCGFLDFMLSMCEKKVEIEKRGQGIVHNQKRTSSLLKCSLDISAKRLSRSLHSSRVKSEFWWNRCGQLGAKSPKFKESLVGLRLRDPTRLAAD